MILEVVTRRIHAANQTQELGRILEEVRRSYGEFETFEYQLAVQRLAKYYKMLVKIQPRNIELEGRIYLELKRAELDVRAFEKGF